MFRTDMGTIQSCSFFPGIGENALALIRKRQVDRRGHLFLYCHGARNLFAKVPKRHITQEPTKNGSVFTEEAEEQMLAFDGHTAELANFVPSEKDDTSCRFCVSFKHTRARPPLRP